MFKLITKNFFPTRILRLLLEHKADVNTKGKNEKYPLDNLMKFAAYVPLMLKYGAKFDTQNALAMAIGQRLSDTNVVKMLVEHNASVKGLENAVSNKDLEMVKVLIELKADVCKQTVWGTPLEIALEEQSFEIAQELMKHRPPKDLFDVGQEDTLLQRHLRSRKMAPASVQFLLKQGIDVNRCSSKSSPPPLFQAITIAPSQEVPLLLIQAKADPNCRSFGTSSLAAAISRSFTDLAKMLVEMNASVNATGTRSAESAPLHEAAKKGDREMIHFLVAKKAEINFSLASNDSVLTCAIKKCPPEQSLATCKLLVELGCSVNLCDALEVAGNKQNTEVFKLLLEHKASSLPKNSGALRLAIAAKNDVFVELLFDLSPQSSQWPTVPFTLRAHNQPLAKKITERILQKGQAIELTKPLMEAVVDTKALEYFQFLLEAHVQFDSCVESAWNSYPLMMAIKAGATQIAHLLIKQGVSINQSVNQHRGAHVVPILEQGFLSLLEALVEQGLDLSGLSHKDCTFLIKKANQTPKALPLLRRASLPILNN